MARDKVVLAYSGGLDTSAAIPWLREERGLDVVTFSADLGQGEELGPVAERAKASGAIEVRVEDLREVFLEEFVWPAVRASASYGRYLLATALGRPLIARELARIGRETGARYVAHGCTGKGNDQVRFEATIAALAPEIRVIAPLREWGLKSREEEIAYAEKHGVSVPVTKEAPYSYDRNLWGQAIECGALEDPWTSPPEDAYLMTVSPEKAPDKAETIELEFEKGVPVGLDGRTGAVELVGRLNELGGRHGVGRVDVIEDRLVGIKSREVYESPGATIISAAHRALEEATIPREVLAVQPLLSQRYGELVYNGLWFGRLRETLDGFFDVSQASVSGTVRLKLYKGNCIAEGRKSAESLYDKDLASYTAADTFDHSAALGFVRIWSLPLKLEAAKRREMSAGKKAEKKTRGKK